MLLQTIRDMMGLIKIIEMLLVLQICCIFSLLKTRKQIQTKRDLNSLPCQLTHQYAHDLDLDTLC